MPVSQNKDSEPRAVLVKVMQCVCDYTHRQTASLRACVRAHNSKASEPSCHPDPNLTVSFSPTATFFSPSGPQTPLYFFPPLLPSPMFTGCERSVSRKTCTVITHDALFKRHVRMKSNERACVQKQNKKKRLETD